MTWRLDSSERISTIDKFDDVENEIDENDELFNDIIKLIDREITWFQLLKAKPKRIHQIANIRTAYNLISTERSVEIQRKHNEIEWVKRQDLAISDLQRYHFIGEQKIMLERLKDGVQAEINSLLMKAEHDLKNGLQLDVNDFLTKTEQNDKSK